MYNENKFILSLATGNINKLIKINNYDIYFIKSCTNFIK